MQLTSREISEKLQDVMKGVETEHYNENYGYRYTLSELLERLPKSIEYAGITYWRVIEVDRIGYFNVNADSWWFHYAYIKDDDITNATAKLLLWVASEGHLQEK